MGAGIFLNKRPNRKLCWAGCTRGGPTKGGGISPPVAKWRAITLWQRLLARIGAAIGKYGRGGGGAIGPPNRSENDDRGGKNHPNLSLSKLNPQSLNDKPPQIVASNPLKTSQPNPSKRPNIHPLKNSMFGPHPQYGWDFPEEIPEEFRKDPGNALRAFPGISLESTVGMPQTL